MIGSGNYIGPRTFNGDYPYVSSYVCICGFVNIGQYSLLGANSTIRDFYKIGDSVFDAMDASIQINFDSGSVVHAGARKIFLKDSRIVKAVLVHFFKS